MMNSKHPENDIDRIFKSAIDSQETEPSDKFWIKAYDDIIQRENRIYNKQIWRWKAIACMLGAAMVVIAFYTFYMHNRINGIQKQLIAVEQEEATPLTETKTVTSGATTLASNTSTANSLTNTVTAGNTTTMAAIAGRNSNSVSVTADTTVTTTNKTVTVKNTSQPIITGSSRNHSNPEGKNVGSDTSSSNKNSIGFGGNTLPESNTAIAASNGTGNASTQLATSAPKDSGTAMQRIAPAAVKPSDTTLLTNNTTAPDTSKPVMRTNKMLAPKPVLTKLFISTFFSPELSDEHITNNDAWDNTTANAVKAREDDGFTYTAGVKAGYDLSKHWSVLTGVYYHSYSFSVSPNEIQASWYNNQVGYLMVTSAGTFNLPCKDYQTIGDSIKASGNSTMSYVSIPLQLRYNLTGTSHIGFYIDGGFTANILLHNNANTYWQTETLQDGSATLQACEGLEKSFCAYNAGFGITYKLAKSLSIFGEPELQGALTPENKSSAITTYPYLFGLSVGLTYHL